MRVCFQRIMLLCALCLCNAFSMVFSLSFNLLLGVVLLKFNTVRLHG